MTTAEASRRHPRWFGIGLVFAVVVGASLALGRSGFSDPLTGSLAWMVSAPAAIAATFVVALWNSFLGNRRMARWTIAAGGTVALYWLGGAVTGSLIAAGATGSLAFAVVSVVPGCGWTFVLALLQALAIVASEEADLRRRRRWPLIVIFGGPVVIVSVGVLASSVSLGTTDHSPAEVVVSGWLQSVSTVLVYGWMLSLVIMPTVFFVLAARASGLQRRGLARIAIGALVPALVVLLCGLLAALAAEAMGRSAIEAVWLAAAFAAGLVAACFWLSATVREATASSGGALTSIATVLRLALWLVYVLGVVQVVTLVVPLFGGGGAAAGAIAMAFTLGVTFWPWMLFVVWCVRRNDPRTAVVAAALAAARVGEESAGALCERILRDALGDREVRVMLAREGGILADIEGGRVAPSAHGCVRLEIKDAAGNPLGVVEHRDRFTDLRPLSLAVRPLFERALWELELREHAERILEESARADAAGSEARRRIERDLHDGVQGRLVSLGLGLRMARDDATDPISRDVLDGAVSELKDAVAELRELSSGMLGVRLDRNGLAGAIGDLARRISVPVEIDIPHLDLPLAVETAAYFVIAESLTNAIKHADPARISVRVVAGDHVTVVVADDGRGGADPRCGTGLRGLRERVQSVGGQLIVSERTPRGTVVEALLPCEW
jgi:signal transduction histidine kinase